MKMNRHKISWLIVLLVVLTGCSHKSPHPANLQVISMIPGVKEASFEITPLHSSSEKQTISLSYASASGYYQFEPGKYDITYKGGKTTLLKHTLVLGKESYQTLVAIGMLHDSLRINPHTNTYAIKNVLAGSESHDPNGYLPQFVMLRDLYRGKQKEGMVRLLNASPFAKNVIVKRDDKKIIKTLRYPKYSEPLPVKPGTAEFNFYLGSVRLSQKEIPIEEGYIHTIITGNSTSSDTSLKVLTYKNLSESARSK